MTEPIDIGDRETTPRGKIGRAPYEVRNTVNRMLRDNMTAEAIQGFLAAKGIEGVSSQNISSWKANGYQKWLRDQERIERMQATVEYAQRLVSETGANGMTVSSDAAARIAVDKLITVMDDFDPGSLSQLLALKPEKFPEVIHALATLRKGDQAAVILQQKVDAYERGLKKLLDLTADKGVATEADVKEMFKEAYGIES
jgi:hypothetical protein